MRLRRKHRDGAPARSLATWRLVDGVGVVVFVILVAGLFASLVYVRLRPQPARYEGRVVDKSITLSESDQGSGKILRLHVQGRGGAVSAVKVDYDTYMRARIGMWVRNDGRGPQLSWDEPAPADSATNTKGAETPSVSAPR